MERLSGLAQCNHKRTSVSKAGLPELKAGDVMIKREIGVM